MKCACFLIKTCSGSSFSCLLVALRYLETSCVAIVFDILQQACVRFSILPWCTEKGAYGILRSVRTFFPKFSVCFRAS